MKVLRKTWSLILIILIFVFLIVVVENNVTGDNQQKHYCSDEDRLSESCTQIYLPVCGFPEQRTRGNACIACMHETVIYYTEGACQ